MMGCKGCGGKFGTPRFVKKIIKWKRSLKTKTKSTTNKQKQGDSFGG